MNGEYVNSFALATIGNMNAQGTAEEFIISEKPANINDEANMISNPDFAASTHNGAPAGWLSDITLGGGTNPRIQEKSQTTELSAYPDGKKAFMIRYDGAATYFSYPVNLKANTSYEYSFDVIAWGSNTNALFDVVVSTSVSGASGIAASKTVTTPAVQATVGRNSIRFTTGETENETYYLTFKKVGSVGTIGITDLYLSENVISGILFGKNYTSGSASYLIDYISVDYSGAYAPSDNNEETFIEDAKSNDVNIYTLDETLVVKSGSTINEVKIYDSLGRLISDVKCNTTEFSTALTKGTISLSWSSYISV